MILDLENIGLGWYILYILSLLRFFPVSDGFLFRLIFCQLGRLYLRRLSFFDFQGFGAFGIGLGALIRRKLGLDRIVIKSLLKVRGQVRERNQGSAIAVKDGDGIGFGF